MADIPGDATTTATITVGGTVVNQRIDLNPESFSNIGGRTGNVAIARGTIIENESAAAGRT